MLMRALCYEQEGRLHDALRLAEKSARQTSGILDVYKIVVRLAIANKEHEKATEFVERALALPEVRTEMAHRGVPKWLRWLTLNFLRLPFVRSRMGDTLAKLEPGNRAMELQTWKHGHWSILLGEKVSRVNHRRAWFIETPRTSRCSRRSARGGIQVAPLAAERRC